jgi:hypothetical protein
VLCALLPAAQNRQRDQEPLEQQHAEASEPGPQVWPRTDTSVWWQRQAATQARCFTPSQAPCEECKRRR